MGMKWKSRLRADRAKRLVRIIWAENYPDKFEIHAPVGGLNVLYVNGREAGIDADILELVKMAEMSHTPHHT